MITEFARGVFAAGEEGINLGLLQITAPPERRVLNRLPDTTRQ